MYCVGYRKLYYADQGGNGLPSKIGGMSLSGSNPFVVLQRRVEKPEYITMDRNTETLYWTDSGRQWVRIPIDTCSAFICLNTKIFYGYFLIVECEKKCQSFTLFFLSCSQFCGFIKICGYQFWGIFEKHTVNSWTVVALPIKSVVVFPS